MCPKGKSGKPEQAYLFLCFQNFGKQSQYRRFYYQPSTFLHNFDPPVYMSDDEDSQGYGGSVETESQADSVDDFVDETVSVINKL